MSRSSLSFKITISIMLIFLVGMIVALSSLFVFNKSKQNARIMAVFSMPLTEQSTNIAENTLKMRIWSMGYAMSGREDYYEGIKPHYTEAVGNAREMIQMLNRIEDSSLDALKSDVILISRLLENYYESLETTHNNFLTIKNLEAEIVDYGDEIANQIQLLYDFVITLLQAESNSPTQYQASLNRMSTILKKLHLMIYYNEKAVSTVRLATSDKNIQPLEGIEDIVNIMKAEAQEIQALVRNPQSSIYVNAIISGIDEASSLVIPLTEGLINVETQQAYREGVGVHIEEVIDSIYNISITGTQHSSEELYELLVKVNLFIIGLTILMFLIGLAVALYVYNSVTKKLADFVNVVGELTQGDGDLTQRIRVTSNDEIGELADRFNTFIENVHDIITEVKTSAEEVASGNNELASTMEQLSSNFQLQSQQVSSVANNMDTINNSSKITVASLATNITRMHDANEAIDEGSTQLERMLNNMNEIKQKTRQLSNTIASLSESSAKIGDILSVINDIADQTNLLALNAAIEAARAGDAGRGFAVVADEVRKLAERTQRSTSEIADIIASLQSESGMASKEMQGATFSVEEGLVSITKTDELFESVVDAVKEVNETTTDVNDNMTDQFLMIQNINDNTQALATGIEESVHAVNEVTNTVSHLQHRADGLKRIVSKFKV